MVSLVTQGKRNGFGVQTLSNADIIYSVAAVVDALHCCVLLNPRAIERDGGSCDVLCFVCVLRSKLPVAPVRGDLIYIISPEIRRGQEPRDSGECTAPNDALNR